MPVGVYLHRKRPVDERFWEKVDKNGPIPGIRPDLGPCWIWTANCANHGYGSFRLDGQTYSAPVLAHQLLVGPIPSGHEPDHLCRVRACVRVILGDQPGGAHIEVVTKAENILRGTSPPAINAAKTHCIYGHPLVGDNLYVHPKTGYRSCVLCRSAADARYAARRNKGGLAQRSVFSEASS